MTAPCGNLVEEFEESFQSCLNVLTNQEAGPCVEKEEVKVQVERFIDLARQMEAFFLQKRFLLSALKPELLVKEDNDGLRSELARKEELLKKHYDKIAVWQNLLADLHGYAKCSVPAAGTPTGTGSGPVASPAPPSTTPQSPMQVMQPHQQHNPMQMQHAAVAAQAQQLQQLQQLHQQQHQQQQQQQHVAAAMQQQMSGAVPGMYMQQGPRGSFPQPGSLQGPLAYLEKTTTNIDLVGMGDGRR
ncbi:uncharacterized protein LOC143914717 [Arctopsyche grandis]|uniref:uncharacterized protein LOC143914717 n=1 Tax=Arctopsyche grandis TaxID=121162 RepID=UPI00406D6C68